MRVLLCIIHTIKHSLRVLKLKFSIATMIINRKYNFSLVFSISIENNHTTILTLFFNFQWVSKTILLVFRLLVF